MCVCLCMVYAKVDAQCDKLATVVSRTKLTTLSTVDMPRRHFSKSRIQNKVLTGSVNILEIPELRYNTVYDMRRKVSLLRTSWIRSAVSMHVLLVMDGQTDTGQ